MPFFKKQQDNSPAKGTLFPRKLYDPFPLKTILFELSMLKIYFTRHDAVSVSRKAACHLVCDRPCYASTKSNLLE